MGDGLGLPSLEGVKVASDVISNYIDGTNTRISKLSDVKSKIENIPPSERLDNMNKFLAYFFELSNRFMFKPASPPIPCVILRILTKLEGILSNLDTCHGALNTLYSEGAVEGFSEKPLSFAIRKALHYYFHRERDTIVFLKWCDSY